MKADLHIHSKYSDGSYNVSQLIDKAITKGIDVIAITDHDTIGVKLNETINTYVKVLIGIELSTNYNGESVHLLGYFPKNQAHDPELITFLDNLSEERITRVNKIIDKLKTFFDIDIKYDDVKKYADGTIGRPHIAKAIMEKYPYSFDAIFDMFIGDGKKAYVKPFDLSFESGVQLLHKYNALTIIAHPGLLKRTNIDDLIALGVDGIEVYSSAHNEAQINRFYQKAIVNNLLITGGSDFHDENITPDLGSAYIKDNDINIIMSRLI